MTEPYWSASRVARCLNLTPLGADQRFSDIVTDTRKMVSGALFVCLRGDRFDGHDFIEQAVAAGAAGVLLERNRWPAALARTGVAIFEVESTLDALRRMAGAYRDEFAIPFIVVAGSVGKTTTKELLAAALTRALDKPVHRTVGSENGFLGIALTLLKLRPEHAAAVIEVGIDDIGAMQQHLGLVRPDGALVTAIGPEHLENLRDLDTVAREECFALDDVLARGKAAAIQLDDPWIAQRFRAVTGCNIVGATSQMPTTYAGRVVTATVIGADDGGTRLHVTLDDKSYDLTVPVPGIHNARNALLAFAMGAALGLKPALLAQGIGEFKTIFGRGEVSRFDNGVVVFRDYYNANPTSVTAALAMLATASDQETWACLGDMLELGGNERTFHEDLAAALAAHAIRHVFLYGERMRWLYERLRAQSFAGDVRHFATHAHMAAELVAGVQSKARVLIKGSRGMRMEEVWKAFRDSYSAKALPGA